MAALKLQKIVVFMSIIELCPITLHSYVNCTLQKGPLALKAFHIGIMHFITALYTQHVVNCVIAAFT